MLVVVVAFHLMSLHHWSFTCLPIVIISASVGRIVCTVCALLVQVELCFSILSPIQQTPPWDTHPRFWSRVEHTRSMTFARVSALWLACPRSCISSPPFPRAES